MRAELDAQLKSTTHETPDPFLEMEFRYKDEECEDILIVSSGGWEAAKVVCSLFMPFIVHVRCT